ncbi:hypothetical protein WR25_01198 [Diploscapter pachys]|uniref:Uncharacterized protein n=1 Tax=Diploscapter pachys TaxID=2018661 RepID=A0A2A2K8B6_9BILA|nr:hypothetical protein WR25_01198 [Diploscapter pachys]
MLAHLLHVPADRLALAIGVGRQDQAVGGLRQIGDGFELLRLVRVILPLHREALVGIHRPVLRRQVADVAVGGEHPVIRAEVFFDGLRFGGRFDDDELHGGDYGPYVYARGWKAAGATVNRGMTPMWGSTGVEDKAWT